MCACCEANAHSPVTTGSVIRPFVSPWKLAIKKCAPSPAAPASAPRTVKASRSPAATEQPASPPTTASVTSTTLDTSNSFASSTTSEFWSRDGSRPLGTITTRSGASSFERRFANEADVSCRQKMCTPACASFRSAAVRACLPVTSESTSRCLSGCHEPGASVFSTCTRIASKMARQSVCSGREMRSSSADTSGYFVLLISESSCTGRFNLGAPSRPAIKMGVTNKNSSHCAHQSAIVCIEPA
mmetsp:Transcript_3501/g.8760  ORF Transcript_3501/g.8760 Transcript_3501/m.8760 type:complete len:243 (+) Transcript_3501:636-1364(+)